MRIGIDPQGDHSIVEVSDEEIIAAYKAGGLLAVNELVQEAADQLESPYYISEHVNINDILRLVEDADES